MPPHNLATIAPPRTLAQVLAELAEAHRDYTDALAANDADAEDRADEAEQRIEELRADFNDRFRWVTGMSVEALMKARESALL